MSEDSFYAPTAYDSTRPRELPPRLPEARLFRDERIRRGIDVSMWHRSGGGGRALAWGICFGDFRNRNSKDDLRELKRGKLTPEKAARRAEALEFRTSRSPKAFWAALRAMSGFFMFVTLIFIPLGYGHLIGKVFGWMFAVSAALFLAGAVGAALSKERNNVIFNRRTGMVELPKFVTWKEEHIPFDQTEAHAPWFLIGKHADTRWRLYLALRSRSHGVEIGVFPEQAHAFQTWEFIQNFMDVSKPLPDVASLEPARPYDPVTAAYDARSGRPASFWRDRETADVLRDAELVDKNVLAFRSWNSGRDEPYKPCFNAPHGVVDPWRGEPIKPIPAPPPNKREPMSSFDSLLAVLLLLGMTWTSYLLGSVLLDDARELVRDARSIVALPVTATVTSREVEWGVTHGRTGRETWIRTDYAYVYEVAGQRYEGRLSYGDHKKYLKPDGGQLERGDTLTVFYDPARPAYSQPTVGMSPRKAYAYLLFAFLESISVFLVMVIVYLMTEESAFQSAAGGTEETGAENKPREPRPRDILVLFGVIAIGLLVFSWFFTGNVAYHFGRYASAVVGSLACLA